MRKKVSKIQKTNFERLISDAAVRDCVGISFINGHYELMEPVSKEFFLMLSDLEDGPLKVGDIYHKEDRAEYISKLKQRANQPDNETERDDKPQYDSKDETNDKKSSDGAANEDRKTSSKGKGYPVNRNTIIPSICTIPIGSGRVMLIFRELKTLPLDKYPNAAAVLLRVFVEMTVDNMIKKKSLEGGNIDLELHRKIEIVAVYFEKNNIMSTHDLKAARRMSSSQHQTNSVQTFHSYVHNASITPIAKDLCSAWDDISGFVKKIWENV